MILCKHFQSNIRFEGEYMLDFIVGGCVTTRVLEF